MGKARQNSSSSSRSSSSGVGKGGGNSNNNKRTPHRAGGVGGGGGNVWITRKPPPPPSSSSSSSSGGGGGGDKYELSPNNRAKCTKCKQPILKGTKRIGKEGWNDMYRKYTYRYYHEQCATDKLKSQLRFSKDNNNQDRNTISPTKNLNDELERQASQKQQDIATISSRNDLREKLCQLRTEFAKRLKVKPFQIFHDTTLNNLILNLPKTIPELKKIHGIGPKKIQYFGESILQVIRQYLNLKPRRKKKDKQQQDPISNNLFLLEQRQDLVHQLKQLRTQLAKKKCVASHEIFTNKTIDDIVVKLPTNKEQLVQVYGIKEKKCQAYGQDILNAISTWSNSKPSSSSSSSFSSAAAAVMVTPNKTKNDNKRYATAQQQQQQQQRKRQKVTDKHLVDGGTANSPVVIDDDDDDDCDEEYGRRHHEEEECIEIMGTLSIENIVQQKFDHATQFGYIISVDDDDHDGDDDYDGFI